MILGSVVSSFPSSIFLHTSSIAASANCFKFPPTSKRAKRVLRTLSDRHLLQGGICARGTVMGSIRPIFVVNIVLVMGFCPKMTRSTPKSAVVN